jgi:hypothetical protein
VGEEIEIFNFIFALFNFERDFLLGLLLRFYNSIAKYIQFLGISLMLNACSEVLVYTIIEGRI